VDHRIELEIDGRAVTTLADILPTRGPMTMLLIGKTPSPVSVDAGHYFQGRQGKLFWGRLEESDILHAGPDSFHDDLLLEHGFGLTDIAKQPRPFGEEPSAAEYEEGWQRVAGLVVHLRPRILTFVYKGSLDRVLRLSFGWRHSAGYGFNDDLVRTFGRRVFAFPLPGTPCTLRESQRAMADLVKALAMERP
jgi:hypothetical protein